MPDTEAVAPATGENAAAAETEVESATDFPIVQPGAVVAQEPLPEGQFPLFPYDPEQDQPAAVQF